MIVLRWLLNPVYRIKQFFDTHNVRSYFPDESTEVSTILLVYDPTTPNASKSPVERAKHVNEVGAELIKFAQEVADMTSELVPVEHKWHGFVAGKDGTTLNA